MAPAGPEEELPLDVPYTKLLDWLIERKQLKPDWQDQLKGVRAQLEAALRELPEGVAEIGSLMKGKQSSLNFYMCKRIMELLEGAQEGRVRNFFGSYTTPLLRAWATVLKAYERDNVYLGEAARALVQQGVYTCPSLRRAIAQLEKQIGDGARKVADCDKTAQELERRFRQACAELEIPLPSVPNSGSDEASAAAAMYEAVDFRVALLGRTNALPGLFEEVEALARTDAVGEALAYYGDVRRFLRHAHSSEPKEEEEAGSEEMEAFPVLRRVRAGERVELSQEEEGGVLEIDWDAAMAGDASAALGGEAAAGEIDWGAAGAGDVDWGVEGGQDDAAAPEAAAVAPVEGGEGEIDWAIEVEEAGAGAVEDSAEASARPVPTAVSTSGAVGEGSGSLLADAGLRSELLNDLLELQSFLRQRRIELAADEEDGVAFVGQYQGQHAALQQQSLGAVDKHLEAVGTVLAKLRSPQLQSLLMIQASPAYLDRVVAGLHQKLEHMAKMRRARAEAEARREAAITELGKAVPEYEATASATRALKVQVEQSLRTLLKGRCVHIIGDINTL